MLNYYKKDNNGVIVELISFNDPVPVYDENNEIIGYQDDANQYIKDNYLCTDKEIVQLVDGTFCFADEVDFDAEAEKLRLQKLAEAKKHAEEVQYHKYQKEKYSIAWVERTDGTKIGFDTDIAQGSQTDWHSVRRIIDDGIALGMYAEGVEPTAPYKYWKNEHEKEYGVVTLTELIKAGLISSQTQNKAYAAFEAIKAEIAKCQTIEEVQKYLVD